jgi:tetratricopeptide (TPR) repeat protein
LNSFVPAIGYYRAALELLPERDEGQRGEILYALGQARFMAESEGVEELQECVAILEDRNPELAADALSAIAILSKQDQRRTFALFEQALDLVRDRPATKLKASVLSLYGGQLHLAHEPARAFELTQEAVEIAEEVGDVEQLAQALLATGNVDDMERALQLAVESDYLTTAARCYGNVADASASHQADLGRCFALQTEARRIAERIGSGPMLDWITGESSTESYLRGRWDEAVDVGEPLVEQMASSRYPHFIEVPTRVVLASIAIARDDGERAEHESIVALDKSRGVGDLQVFYTAVACRAVALLESGNEEAAGRLVSEFIEHLTGEVERTGQAYTPWLERLTLAWLSLRFGHADDLADLLARDARPVGSPWAEMASPWAEMMRPMLQGDLLTAASRAEEHLLLPDAAWLRLQAARGGDMSGLDQALVFYEDAGASRYIREAGELAAA